MPREVIDKYPEFADLVYKQQLVDKPIEFYATGRVGHTIVHFLFTGKYQTLRPSPDNETHEPSAAFTEAVQVYHVAVVCGLDDLAELATKEIARQGEGKTFSSIVNAMSRVTEVFEGDKTWLVDYLADRAATAYDEVTEDDISKLQDIDCDNTLVQILFKANRKLKLWLQHAEESDGSSME